MIHAKKVKPVYFEALLRSEKTFELRHEDPDEPRYAVGDYLALNECESGKHCEVPTYTGRCLLFLISYVLRDHPLLAPGAVALGLQPAPLIWPDLVEPRIERQREE